MGYNNNVFINCPFDTEYAPLLRAMLFTVLYLDYKPYISQTISSAQVRNNQIKEHIRSCQFGIHDLSRCHCKHEGDLPRFNMPYELGLDIGSAEFGYSKLRNKRILILEKERYYYQKILSDIAGQDIFHHDGNPDIIIKNVRDWFSNNNDSFVTPYHEIWRAYNLFKEDLFSNYIYQMPEDSFNEMIVGDYIKFTRIWISRFKSIEN
ncbi:MAG: hypothetical protein ACR2IL_07690 [Chitinophagaceae bacterium]